MRFDREMYCPAVPTMKMSVSRGDEIYSTLLEYPPLLNHLHYLYHSIGYIYFSTGVI